jgi:hypothetical protein
MKVACLVDHAQRFILGRTGAGLGDQPLQFRPGLLRQRTQALNRRQAVIAGSLLGKAAAMKLNATAVRAAPGSIMPPGFAWGSLRCCTWPGQRRRWLRLRGRLLLAAGRKKGKRKGQKNPVPWNSHHQVPPKIR